LLHLQSFFHKKNQDVYKFPEHHLVNTREIIRIPDIEGYQTLKCDFHTHTIFSDGHVSPVLRVNEAWSNGLDAIAITDHIEYHPFKEYVVADHKKYSPHNIKAKARSCFQQLPG
jgi:3',5'-nucleoside bisphosphate phosphatase